MLKCQLRLFVTFVAERIVKSSIRRKMSMRRPCYITAPVNFPSMTLAGIAPAARSKITSVYTALLHTNDCAIKTLICIWTCPSPRLQQCRGKCYLNNIKIMNDSILIRKTTGALFPKSYKIHALLKNIRFFLLNVYVQYYQKQPRDFYKTDEKKNSVN